jgi:hypothetical protein
MMFRFIESIIFCTSFLCLAILLAQRPETDMQLADNTRQLMSHDARIKQIEDMRLDARLARMETQWEFLQTIVTIIVIPLILLVISEAWRIASAIRNKSRT